VSLIHGVTGSGKTEIYFHVIEQMLKSEKQSLLMLPEIGLTQQIVERFETTFGTSCAVWHSSISPAKKRDIFFGVNQGSCKVLIGTRSSLFLPFKNLGVIIVDEEHDGSYKQEEMSLYNARDGAVLRGYIENAKVILVSATPSVETYNNAKTGRYHHVILGSRFGNAQLPNINIVDMKKQERGNWISAPLKNAIANALSIKKQVILFINRKGYAPLILCVSCGFRFTCNHCSSWLVYHQESSALICHHCGYNIKYPNECPYCGGNNLVPCGPGVERVAEEAASLFPDAIIKQFTKDYNPEEEEMPIIKMIENGMVDIIVGTQILTKGYNFPNVTVVGIIDADTSMSNIDLKATERCFQILSQVSGRAGRSEHEGLSFLQTYYPANEIFEYIRTSNPELFYETEIKRREDGFLPPASRIIALIITGDHELETLDLAKKVRNSAPKTERVRILGPAPATMSKLRGKYRFRLLLISDKTYNIQNYASAIISKFSLKIKHRIRVEVDPYSFY
ncbi:MAG: primosomal protein N', partial [Rickettsiaceae bacterium]|nr:primosomal protein N' [Rickettsiaceae bacterium]